MLRIAEMAFQTAHAATKHSVNRCRQKVAYLLNIQTKDNLENTDRYGSLLPFLALVPGSYTQAFRTVHLSLLHQERYCPASWRFRNQEFLLAHARHQNVR